MAVRIDSGGTMTAVVTTTKGRLQGVREGDNLVFKGIPYASPPVGELRFRAPQEASSWQGVRQASEFGPRAMQVASEALEALLGNPEGQPRMDEDCLYLNVRTPALDGVRRPVMVWLHGGGFAIGAGSDPLYQGSALVDRGVVLVTINYRLGPFGYLYAPDFASSPEDSCGNFGLLDQIAALRWVRSEIAAFGGDPENVTVFGESAGAMSIGALLASPPAAGLFDKAILQSGAAHQVLTEDVAIANAAAFGEALGRSALDASLRSRPAAELMTAQAKLAASGGWASGRSAGLELFYRPVIGGRALPGPPIEAIRGGCCGNVPILIGTTLDEYRLFGAMSPRLREISEDRLVKRVSQLVPDGDIERAGSLVGVYRRERSARGENVSPYDLFCAIATDWLFRVPADRLAEAQSANNGRVFHYRLDWRSPYEDGALGACHAIDLPFVFGTQRLARRWVGRGEEVDALAARIGDAWVAFASGGDPSTASLPWPAFEAKERRTVVLGSECRVESCPHEAERRCWDGVIA
ncbi:MAG: carboxylesterase/lipase family protein [Dehalococcoidia bacterium]